MLKRITEYLQELGLSDLEAKLYEGLLETGPTTVMELAQHVGIKRITAHFNVESLIKKGLITQIVHGARRKIMAEHPNKLNFILEQKAETVTRLQSQLPDIVKMMSQTTLQSSMNQNVQVKYYEGKNAVKLIYKDVLSAEKIRSYVNLDRIGAIFPENVDLFIDAQKKNKNLEIVEIVDGSETAKELVKQYTQNERYRYKFAPSTLRLSAADVMIYSGKVAVVNITENTSGMIFENEDYYNTSTEIFDFIWRVIPDASD